MFNLVKYSKGSFRGVPFHLADAAESTEWDHASYKYLNNHTPDFRRYSKEPGNFKVDGYLMGRDATLLKDMLSKACDLPTPGKLIHPLFGSKDAICVARQFSALGDAFNAFSFSLLLKEVVVKHDDFISQFVAKVDEINDLIADYALQFTETVAVPISSSVFALDRACKAFLSINNALQTLTDVTLVSQILDFLGISSPGSPPAVSSIASQMLNPLFLSGFVRKTSKVLKQANETSCLEGLTKLLPMCQTSNTSDPSEAFFDPTAQIVAGILFLTIAEREVDSPIGPDYLPVVLAITHFVKDDSVFAFIWGIKSRLEQQQPKAASTLRPWGVPSLVRAYKEHRDLNKAEELAHAAEQPFSV